MNHFTPFKSYTFDAAFFRGVKAAFEERGMADEYLIVSPMVDRDVVEMRMRRTGQSVTITSTQLLCCATPDDAYELGCVTATTMLNSKGTT